MASRVTWSCDSSRLEPSSSPHSGLRRRTAEYLRNSFECSPSTSPQVSRGSHTEELQASSVEAHDIDEDLVPFDISKDVEIIVDRGISESFDYPGEEETADDSASDVALAESLAESLIKARVEAMNGSFIPRITLMRIMTAKRVRQSLLANLPGLDRETVESLVQSICQPASTADTERGKTIIGRKYLRVFAILVLLGKEAEFLNFIETGYSDKDLPLSRRDLEYIREQYLAKKRRAWSQTLTLPNMAVPAGRQELEPLERSDHQVKPAQIAGAAQPTDARSTIHPNLATASVSPSVNDRPWTEKDIAKFEAEQWGLIAPVFLLPDGKSDVRYYQLEDNDILPFSSVASRDGSVDSAIGGYSRVRKVEIHPQHHHMAKYQDTSTVRLQLAIKSLAPHAESSFAQELAALQHCAKLTQAHITPLWASYKQGGTHHFVFPWARSDLHGLWNMHPGPPQTYEFQRWVAEQLQGLTTALVTVHGMSQTADQPGGSNTVYGRHGDLKPANILFFIDALDEAVGSAAITSGTLKIADFGLTSLHRSTARHKEYRHTSTYRAPEYDLQSGVTSQAYDIWSLGAIYLEFMTWLLTGSSGMGDKFTTARTSDGPSDHPDDNYFIVKRDPTAGTKQAVVKPSVTEWIKMLRRQPAITPYYESVLNLVQHGMLVVNEERRYDAATCSIFLQDARPLLRRGGAQRASGRLLSELFLHFDEDKRKSMIAQPLEAKDGISRLRLEPIDATLRKMNRFDKARILLERWVGEMVDWSPLPPPNRFSQHAVARLTWVYGGQEMWISLDGAQYAKYRDRLRAITPGILPVAKSTPGSALQSGSKSVLMSIWSIAGNSMNRVLRSWQRPRKHAGATAVSASTPSSLQTNTQKESYFCADRYWTSFKQTHMYTVPSIDALTSDYELFVRLRSSFATAHQSWFQRLTSTRTCTQVQLSKFTFLFKGRDLVKAFEQEQRTGTQTIDLCKGYEYSCVSSLDITEHMQLMAETILQGLQNPDLGRGSRAVLAGIPKLESPPGLAREQYNSGWGFYMRQGLCVRLIAAWLGVIASLGVAFMSTWLAVVDAADVQTSLAPMTTLANIASVLFTIVIGMEALGAHS